MTLNSVWREYILGKKLAVSYKFLDALSSAHQ
uniref:Uncharacterized protein n=1 Tax=Arundo donax TaxID=35708 RepID=A0A0A9BTX8_ARUDO